MTDYIKEYRNVIKNWKLMRIITAGVISAFGSKISYFALLRKVYAISGGRVTDLGFLTVCEIIPSILLGTVAGVLIDRLPRKWVMICSDIMNGMIIFTVIYISELRLIYAVAFAAAAVNVFREPAQRALEPNLVDRQDIPLLNSFVSSTNNLVTIVGSATGAAIVGFVGANNAFVIDAATFWISAAIIFTIPLVEEHWSKDGRAGTIAQGISGFLDGVSIMWKNKSIKLMVFIEVYLTFAMAMQGMLIYYFIKQTLKMGDKAELAWGTLLSGMGIGAVAGSLVIGIIVKRYRNRFKLFLNILIFDGIFFAAFLLNKYFPLSVALFMFLGVIGSAYMIILNSVLHDTVPDENRGKVFSALSMLKSPVAILSILVGTAAAVYITAQGVLLIAAGLEIMIALGVRLTRTYREVDTLYNGSVCIESSMKIEESVKE